MNSLDRTHVVLIKDHFEFLTLNVDITSLQEPASRTQMDTACNQYCVKLGLSESLLLLQTVVALQQAFDSVSVERNLVVSNHLRLGWH